jgi:hypothetical protein
MGFRKTCQEPIFWMMSTGLHRGEKGLSSIGLISMMLGLFLMAVLLLYGMNEFGASSSSGGSGAGSGHSILSNSNAETQLKLCVEGRDSTYGSPPSPAQQASCIRQLLGQVTGSGS